MSLSKVLIVHNSYQQPGGEDAVFNAEAALLRQRGHKVTEYREDNGRVNVQDDMVPVDRLVEVQEQETVHRSLRGRVVCGSLGHTVRRHAAGRTRLRQ